MNDSKYLKNEKQVGPLLVHHLLISQLSNEKKLTINSPQV